MKDEVELTMTGTQQVAAPKSTNQNGSPPLPSPARDFPRLPGETPRAFSAFAAFFELGHDRSLPAAAAHLGEHLSTLKKWSARFRWNARILEFSSGRLQQQADSQAAALARQTKDWSRRSSHFREQQWQSAQKLLVAVQCFLDSLGDRELERMTLAQVSRALQVSNQLAGAALAGTNLPQAPSHTPLQLELLAALKKSYANPPSDRPLVAPPPTTTSN